MSENDSRQDIVRWTDKDTFVWYIRGGELDGTYYLTHYPNLVEDYEGEVVLWYWDRREDWRHPMEDADE